MSVTQALTCPSLLKALTSSKWDTVLPWGLLIVKYGMSHIFIHAISRFEGERDKGVLHLCLLSKTYSSWLQSFRPFHVVGILPSPHLALSGCCRRDGPHQHYSLQSIPSQGSHCFLAHSASNDTPQITRAHMLTCAHTLGNCKTSALDAKLHTNESPSILLGGKLSHGPSARVN